MELIDYVLFLIVANCWGISNVLIKKNTKGIKDIKYQSKIKQIKEEMKYLLFNWKVLVYF